MSGIGRYFPGSAVQRSSYTDNEDKSPLLSDEKVEPREYGTIFTPCEPVRSESRRQLRTHWKSIAATATLLLLLLVTPLGCITTDFLGNLKYYILFDVLRFDHQYYPDLAASVNSSIIISNKMIRIVLLGDSLINRPCTSHNLTGKIKTYLSQYDYTFEITNCGFDGSRIENTKSNTLAGCALPHKPHAVILFWDTDCSNIAEYTFSDAEILKLRESYVSNIHSVVTTLMQTGQACIICC